MNEIIETQSSFFEFVENSIIKNKKMSHAYLIETKGFSDYNLVVKELIKIILTLDKNSEEKENICNLVDNNNYPDLKYIYPDGAYIKKEQLLQLESQYMKKSLLNNKLIYVIDGAEKLNQSSANTILKFLEEPPEDIVAILLTENKYTVLETIVSRCQCLSLINSSKEEFSDEVKEFVNDIFSPKKILVNYDYYMENLFIDRMVALENLKSIEECLFSKLKYDDDRKKIIDQIELIETEKERLSYNINMKLWLSNYIFSIMEVSRNA